MTADWFDKALRANNVELLRPEEAFFDATLRALKMQRRAAGLKASYICQEESTVRHFADYCGLYPWQWGPEDFVAYTEYRSSDAGGAVGHSTLIGIHGAIRRYCDYLLGPGSDWAERAFDQFGSIPAQVCFPWNSRRHRSPSEASPQRRPFTYSELDTLWSASIDWVRQIAASGQKGWLPAMRDITLFKTAWSFGLRRNELRMLDTVDFHRNPAMPQWGRYGKIAVRYGKSSRGGQPKRRTAFMLPMYQSVIPEMERWTERLRPQTQPPSDLPAVFVSERRTRMSLRLIDSRFATLRDFAGLPEQLTLHSLRRSHISHIQDHGIPALFAQYQAGHSHPGTTAIYTHESDGYRSKVVRKANEAYERTDDLDVGQHLGVERPESDV